MSTNSISISKLTRIIYFFIKSDFNLYISYSLISKEYPSIRKKLYTTKVNNVTNKIINNLSICNWNIIKI